MRCPRCDASMDRLEEGYDGACVVSRCPACEGYWLDPGELDELDQSVWTNAETLPLTDEPLPEPSGRPSPGYRDAAGEPPDGDLDRVIDCPRCRPELAVPLRRASYDELPELVIDRCDRCRGFWLDGGELEQVRELVSRVDAAIVAGMRWGPGRSLDDLEGKRGRRR